MEFAQSAPMALQRITDASDPARLNRVGVPAEYRTARTKSELDLMEIDRAIAADVRFGCVLADAGYGMSAPFRQALTAHKLTWAVGIPRHLKVYPADVRMIWPVAKRGRPRAVADEPPQRIKDKGQQHLPGEEAWLIGEHRMSGEKKYYLANLSAKTNLRTLAATIKAR